ncbi:MAG: NAD-dependent epimerase/dehydratase family protein [Parvularculaceae bacterium]
MNDLSGRTIFVAGAGGFLGSRICLAAARAGARVAALSRSGRARGLAGAAGIEIVRGDLLDPPSIAASIGPGVDVVNAAYDFLADDDDQRAAFDNLLSAAQSAKARSFVQISSIAVYDEWPTGALNEDSPCDGPGNSYKALKREFELKLADAAAPHTILQPTIVYGTGGWQWTDRLIEELEAGRVVLPDDPRGLCHAVHVDDVAAAVLCALVAERRASRCIISGPAPVEWGALYAGYAEMIGAAPPEFQPFGAPETAPLGVAAPPSPLAMKAKRALRRMIGERGLATIRKSVTAIKRGGGEIIARPEGAMLELMRARGSCSIARAKAEIDFTPAIDLAEGLTRICATRRS